MDDVLTVPRCDCRIFAATGLPCRDCPKRQAVPSRSRSPFLRVVPWNVLFRQALGGHGQGNADRLRRPSPPTPGRCCED